MAMQDQVLRRSVMREITKLTQNIDSTLMSIAVISGVVYLGGRIRPLRGSAGRNIDVKHAVKVLQEAIESIRGVSQCVVDAAIEERAQ